MTEATPRTTGRRMSRLALACLLAAGLAVAPGFVPFAGGDHDGAAFAKNGGGNGGKGGGNGGGKGAGKGQGQGKSAKGKTKATGKPAATQASLALGIEPAVPLHPSELGKWNASHASQAALDAHIRNQNFNGTIGALAQFQLAAKAAAGEVLTDAEQAALDSFVGDGEAGISDQELADSLNNGAVDGDPVYSVDDGVVGCSANCDGVDLAAAQDAADAEAERLADEATQPALDDFLADSEARIVDESNKELSPERTEDLLDHLADQLGVTRATGQEEVSDAGDVAAAPVTTVQ